MANDSSLAKRLGEFYEKSEKAFENGAWLSYALLCGGIFEGLLLDKKVAGNIFYDKIEEAEKQLIINDLQKQIMHTARKARNILHANKYNDPYIIRKDAMDIRTTMDVLIKEFSGC